MFDAFVAFHARLQPRSPALLSPARVATYAELDADVNRLATALSAIGLVPASGVTAVGQQDPYLKCAVILALARMGIASAPGYDDRADMVLSDHEEPGAHRRVVLSADWVAETLAADAQPFLPVRGDPDATGRVMLSSGTTKTPRRVAMSWRMVDAGVRSVTLSYGAGRAGRWLPYTGIDSIMGLHGALAAWATGGAAIVGVSLAELPQALETLQPAVLGFTPVFLRTLLRRLPADFALQPNLRVVVGGGALPASVARECRLRLSPDLKVIYGATECSGAAVADASLLERVSGIAGFAVPGVDIRVVDPEGRPVPTGEQGEVRIESERAATAYIDDPEETAKAFHHGGFYPGDLGRLTPDGLLVIDGRLDDRMNLGGWKFQPTTMEDAALDGPGVADAAAFALADETGIDQCWLAIVQGDGFDRGRLVAHLNAYRPALPPYRFAFVDEIPRNAMGKAERNRLRDETIAALAAGRPA